MKLIIEGDELAQALESWVNKLGMNTTGKKVDVIITAGRGVNGSSATVSITESNTDSKVEPIVPLEAVTGVTPIAPEEESEEAEPKNETPVMFGSD